MPVGFFIASIYTSIYTIYNKYIEYIHENYSQVISHETYYVSTKNLCCIICEFQCNEIFNYLYVSNCYSEDAWVRLAVVYAGKIWSDISEAS